MLRFRFQTADCPPLESTGAFLVGRQGLGMCGSMEQVSAPTQPEQTPDGRYILVGGRRWRATDPAIPEGTATRLRNALMAARCAVKAAMRKGDTAAEKQARSQVHSAKVALGERGIPWWEQSMDERRQRWERGLNVCEAERPNKEHPAT
ncbi:hypothetical protein ABTY00_35810 [Streptomyces microflavus]|uniref:hypothetical protein n=1 Tax=Streptomyces microflavus TaxID=1919 RepID=UPI00331C0DF9